MIFNQIDRKRYFMNSMFFPMETKLSENMIANCLSVTLQPYYRELSIKQLGQLINSEHDKSLNALRFDFYLSTYRLVIEFNGEQHYRPFKHFGGDSEFDRILASDAVKKQYCKDNEISMLVLPYNAKVSYFDFVMRCFLEKGPGYYEYTTDKQLLFEPFDSR